MRGARVPERVRCEPDADATTVILNARAQACGAEACTVARVEERRVDLRHELGPARAEIRVERARGGAANRDDTIFAAFAIPHQEQAAAEIEIGDVGARSFSETQACSIEQLEDRAIALTDSRAGIRRDHQ